MFERDFYHIRAWWPSLSHDKDHMNKLLFPYPTKPIHESWLQLAEHLSEEKIFEECGPRTDGARRPAYTIGTSMSLKAQVS